MASIESFMQKFYGPTHEYVHQLDPISTFSIKFKFFPCLEPTKEEKTIEKLVNSLSQTALNAASNAANNVTGGLLAAAGSMFGTSVQKQHNSYSDVLKYSFVNYLANAMMLDKTNAGSIVGLAGSPKQMLVLDISEFIQDITVPFLKMHGGEEINTQIGKFQSNGIFIGPDNNELQLTVLNTKLPIAEWLFYPWMREVTLPFWSYDDQPYTTATVTIDFSKHADIQYVFCGCRPLQIQTIQPNNIIDGNALKRQVTLLFDYMFVTSSNMKVQPNATDVIRDVGAGLVSGGAGLFNI